MKRLMLLLGLAALASCSKEESRLAVRLTATCKMCAVEYVNNGQAKRDTVIGLLTYEWTDGIATVDTLPTSASWNIVREPGDVLKFTACPLQGGSVSLQASGDISTIQSASEDGCASIDQVVSR